MSDQRACAAPHTNMHFQAEVIEIESLLKHRHMNKKNGSGTHVSMYESVKSISN